MAAVNLIGSYNYALVALSVLIAIFASYAALDLAGRVTAAGGWIRAVWLLGGAGAMGTGIWSMHYIGMLAFILPIPVAYHWPTVLLSLLAAILASAVGLGVASRQKMGTLQALAGSVLMGAGIASMHYIGMAAGDSTFHAFLWQNGVMTDLGTLPGDVFSMANAINDGDQVVGQSCNSDFSVCRAFLWQTGVMTDLNTLTPLGSSLYLVSAADINVRGEIVGTAVDQSGEALAFLAVPCDEEHVGDPGCQDAAQNAIGSERPKVVLPETVRKQLQQRMRFGGL
jgi:probable HAF family extracellular repeat protein